MEKRSIEVSIPKTKAKPKKETATTVAEVIIIDSPETRKTVDVLGQLKSILDTAEAEYLKARGPLDLIATKDRVAAEKDGRFAKQVHVKGSELDARYTFRDSYAPIDISARPALQGLLGPLYGTLFTEGESVRIKPEAMAALLQHLGARAAEFLAVETVIKPVDDFRKVRFEARDQLSGPQNNELDKVIKQVAAKPALTLK